MVCRLQDDGSCPTTGYHLSMVLMAHAVVAIAQGELETRRTQTPRQRLGIADTHRARRHPIGERGAWQ